MTFKFQFSAALIGALAWGSSGLVAAAAVTPEPKATFEDLSAGPAYINTPLSSGDFTFVTNFPAADPAYHGIKNEINRGSSNGGNYLVYLASGIRTETFSLTQGGAFDLTHIDIGGWYNSPNNPLLTLTGFKADSNSTVTVELALSKTAFTTFTALNGLADFTALQSVRMSGISNVSYVAVDNINYVPVTIPVPEPETYALMLGGLALVGWAARRRVIKA